MKATRLGRPSLRRWRRSCPCEANMITKIWVSKEERSSLNTPNKDARCSIVVLLVTVGGLTLETDL